MLEALFFDFDGLILDTELPDFIAWQDAFASRGLEFPNALWAEMIGRSIETVSIHPADLIVELLGEPENRENIINEHRRRRQELIEFEILLPGVVERMDEGLTLGLKMAVVSSSGRSWIEGHLGRLGLAHKFERSFCGREGIPAKPDPALYLAALNYFGLKPNQALTFEDSPNGIAAAKEAGIWCVAVPNSLTSKLDLSQADLILESLATNSVRTICIELGLVIAGLDTP